MNNIEIIDLKQPRQRQCRIQICQLAFDEFDWAKSDGLFFIQYNDKLKYKIQNLLNVAKQQSVDLIIFPELSIPDKALEYLQSWSKEHKAIIVAGSHYHRSTEGYISRCPVIINGEVYFTEKLKPSPYEKSPIANEGLVSGTKTLLFKNTMVGDLGILICSDYLDEELKQNINLNNLDILCIPSFQKDSDYYFRRMNTDCENSEKGIYLLFSNFYEKSLGDGHSALFGVMDRLFQEKFKEKQFTDLKPDKKIFDFSEFLSYAVFDLDISNKRPFINKTIHTEPNIYFVSKGSELDSTGSDFSKKITHDDERYKKIDNYFVEPSEYDEILGLLEKNKLIFIIGDPGIGKTYCAVKILKLYYEKGFEPIWFAGLEREERLVQSKILSDFTPTDKQIIYFEDPFGRTIFEKRESLYQIFSPLIESLQQYDTRIIITSRKEVFETFSKESLLENDVLQLKKELNIRKPSYDELKLIQIFLKLAIDYCDWFGNNEFQQLVIDAIKSKKITTPLSIRDLVFVSRKITTAKDLHDKIEKRENEIVKVFALEMINIQPSTKLLLYLIFLMGNKGHNYLATKFETILSSINNSFHESQITSYNIEIRSQIGYRVEQFGNLRTAYRFTHPVYEEALALLVFSDPISELILKIIIQNVGEENSTEAFKILSRTILKYNKVSLLLFQTLLEKDLKLTNNNLRLSLSQKLISTYYVTREIEFFNLAIKFYSLKELVDDLNTLNDAAEISKKLNLVIRYRRNSPLDFDSSYSKNIIWERLFKNKLKKVRTAYTILEILLSAVAIDSKSITAYAKYSSVPYIKQAYLFLKKKDREKFSKLLIGTPIQSELEKYEELITELESNNRKFNSLRSLQPIIFFDNKYYGNIIVDKGAARALSKPWLNLLPVGIIDVEGVFESGTIVAIKDITGQIIAVGMTEYSSGDLLKIKGHQSNEIIKLLGYFHNINAVRSFFLKRFKSKKEFESWEYVQESD